MKNLFTTMLIAFVLLWSQPSMSYIDPGSGSAVMSAIIGFFVAVGIVIKTYWYKLKALFGFGAKKTDSDSSDSPE